MESFTIEYRDPEAFQWVVECRGERIGASRRVLFTHQRTRPTLEWRLVMHKELTRLEPDRIELTTNRDSEGE